MADLLRISVIGTLPGGEEWSVNPVFAIPAPGAPFGYDDCLTLATAVDAITIPTGLRGVINAYTTFSGVRVESRNWDNSLEGAAEHVKSSPVAGTEASTGMPYQTAIVSSLLTAFPGPRGRGRLYWPCTAHVLTPSTLRVNSTTLSNFMAGVKTYLSGIETAAAGMVAGTKLAVWSRASSNAHFVNRIRVGDITDVQRRRRDILVENYSATTYPT